MCSAPKAQVMCAEPWNSTAWAQTTALSPRLMGFNPSFPQTYPQPVYTHRHNVVVDEHKELVTLGLLPVEDPTATAGFLPAVR